MPTLDIVIVIVLIVSALMGMFRGLFKEVLSLVIWLLAFLAGLYFGPEVGQRLGIANNPTAALVIGFIAVFGVTLILGGMVQWAVARLVESTGLSGTDRLLGFVFGGARGAVVCIVALIALQPFVGDAPWWQQSRLQRQLMAFEDDVLSLVGTARARVWELAGQAASGN